MFSYAIFNDFMRIYNVLPTYLRRKIFITFLLVILQVIWEILTLLSISFLAMVIINPTRLATSSIMLNIYSKVPFLLELQEDMRFFTVLAAFIIALIIAVKNMIIGICSIFTAKLGADISSFVGESIFTQYLTSAYIDHLSGNSAKLHKGLSYCKELGFFVNYLMNFYCYITVSALLIIFLFFYVPMSVLLVLLMLAMVAVIIYRAIRKKVELKGMEVTECSIARQKVIQDTINGIREILIYRQQKIFFENFQKSDVEAINSSIYLRIAPAFPSWILEALGFLSIPISMFAMISVSDASMAEMTTVLTMIMLIAWRILPLINRSMGALVSVRTFKYSAIETIKLVEQAKPILPMLEDNPSDNCTFNKYIILDNISFCYPNSKQNCLDGLCFTIEHGKRVGIIGKSGAGKSTIAALLSGLIEPTTGQIFVDDKKLDMQNLASYSKLLGYVPQNPYILKGSIAENVAFSQWGKPWDKDKILRACTMAELDLIHARGIEDMVGIGGTGLSGGQAQRLSIARSLYADPKILIFDEATSSLDGGIEKAIMDTVFTLPQSITAIIIAHRLSTVERCDSILWIHDGRLKMSGSPAEVLPQYENFLAK